MLQDADHGAQEASHPHVQFSRRPVLAWYTVPRKPRTLPGPEYDILTSG